MTHLRTRAAAIAGSMALTMSLALAPAAMAQDGPEAAVEGFIDAIAAKDFEALPGFFCEAEADQAAQFDLAAIAGELPEGLDVGSLLDAFIFDISLTSSEVVSETESEALVRVAGSMSMSLDEEALLPFAEAAIEMSGMEVDEASLAMFTNIIASEFEAESEDFDDEITLVAGDSGWLICSELEFSGGDMSDAMDDDAMDDDDMDDDDMSDAMDDMDDEDDE